MKKTTLLFLTVSLLGGASTIAKEPKDAAGDKPWRKSFDVDKKNLSSVGRNTYFILEPGYVLHYAGGKKTMVITVTDQTKMIDGVETRIVEEREEDDGKLIELTKDYFAIDKATKDVYYFGEDVNEYKDGKVGHDGSLLSGEKGAKFGLMIPGDPKVGDCFYQELAPDVAMDRSEVVSIDTMLETPTGKYEKCLRCKDGSALESGTSDKVYAPGVGQIKDDEFALVKVETPKK